MAPRQRYRTSPGAWAFQRLKEDARPSAGNTSAVFRYNSKARNQMSCILTFSLANAFLFHWNKKIENNRYKWYNSRSWYREGEWVKALVVSLRRPRRGPLSQQYATLKYCPYFRNEFECLRKFSYFSTKSYYYINLKCDCRLPFLAYHFVSRHDINFT